MQNGNGTKRKGTGENKTWNSGAGKSMKDQPVQKTYHKNPDTGKTEEYTGKVYQDDKSKKSHEQYQKEHHDYMKNQNGSDTTTHYTPSFVAPTIKAPLGD